ncbi:TetR/AcrR family transcriptional regulator [Mycobacteroides franklinii]|uniref:TetR/AcrR family transcriptional regulator n=1 Tax=Mycobacteroides franklinii TaxID=948102 RepID=UPI00177DEF96|nr:TetR/AcrR family transcriptional regulator [Mycobacteroides franklinii]
MTTAETRAALVDGAIRCFSTRGYEATSVSELTICAGVSKGSFYRHFPDKRSIFVEAFVERLQVASRLLTDAEDRLADQPYGEGVAILAAAAARFSMLSVTDSVHRELLRQAPEVLGADLHAAIDDQYVLPSLTSLLGVMQERGELTPGLPLATTSALLLRVVCAGNTLVAASSDPRTVAADVLVALVAFYKGIVVDELHCRLVDFSVEREAAR